MKIRNIVTAALVGGMAVVIAANSGLAAQGSPEKPKASTEQATPASGMDAKCQAMMADHDKMMADMKATDLRLDGLVASMKTASGQAKADATAAVVTEMVAQHKTMRDGMMTMQPAMMGHMMNHMQGGMGAMAMCPMMKSMPMGGMKH